MLKHMTVIGRLMNIIEFLNKDGLKLRPLWSVRTRMLPATRRKLISRTHEKRMSPAPGLPERGDAADWCGEGVVPRYYGAGDVLKVPALSTPALLLLKFISHERDARNSIDSRS